MAESTPPEGRRTFEQIRQLNRSLTEKVLDKAASDPEWRELLLEDPEAAMREANFPEAQKLQQSRQPEVTGQRYRYGVYQYGYGSEYLLGGFDDNYYECAYATWYWNRACAGGFTQIH